MKTTTHIIEKSEHGITNKIIANISENALSVLKDLNAADYTAYLVGGSVRDLLLEREPKDFDVATDAFPSELHKLFHNCRLIGKRFRLAHILFAKEIVEVATFRGDSDTIDLGEHTDALDPRHFDTNIFGTLEEDVWRRDFTINALYYNSADETIIDYTGGLNDIKQGVLRIIGDPEKRFQEDPLRMLRAIRFLTKTGFRLDDATKAGLLNNVDLLENISPARIFDEILKVFHHGFGYENFLKLRELHLFEHLFPQSEACLSSDNFELVHKLISQTCQNTDARIKSGKRVTPSFLFAAFLWYPMRNRFNELLSEGYAKYKAFEQASNEVLQEQNQHITISKRYQDGIYKVWSMQKAFNQCHDKHAAQFILNPRFRAAYDFLLLRAEAGEDVQEYADWWTQFQEDNPQLVEKAANIRQERFLRWKKSRTNPKKKGKRRRTSK